MTATTRSNLSRSLFIIVVVSVALRLAASLFLGNEVASLPGIDDQRSYHMLALRVLDGHGFTVPTDWWPVTRAGEPTAHWSYLYTLYLTAAYRVFGVAPVIARVIQAVTCGILWPLLAYRIALRATAQLSPARSQEVALISAGWAALYGYFVYYTAALLTEAFYILGVLWTLSLAQDIHAMLASVEPNKRLTVKWLLLGLAVGCAVLLRQLFLFFVPPLLVWLWWSTRRSGHATRWHAWRVARGALLMAVVVAVLIAPWTALNYQTFHKFVLLNTNAGYAFFWANHPVYGTQFVEVLPLDAYVRMIPPELMALDEVSLGNALFQLSLQQILADPVRYVLLSLSRFGVYFNIWPLSGSGPLSNATRAMSLGLALPFALIGFAFSLRHWRDWLLLYLFVVVYSMIHILSWSLVRYRLPVDAVLLIFAASGLQTVLDRLRRRRYALAAEGVAS